MRPRPCEGWGEGRAVVSIGFRGWDAGRDRYSDITAERLADDGNRGIGPPRCSDLRDSSCIVLELVTAKSRGSPERRKCGIELIRQFDVDLDRTARKLAVRRKLPVVSVPRRRSVSLV